MNLYKAPRFTETDEVRHIGPLTYEYYGFVERNRKCVLYQIGPLCIERNHIIGIGRETERSANFFIFRGGQTMAWLRIKDGTSRLQMPSGLMCGKLKVQW